MSPTAKFTAVFVLGIALGACAAALFYRQHVVAPLQNQLHSREYAACTANLEKDPVPCLADGTFISSYFISSYKTERSLWIQDSLELGKLRQQLRDRRP